MQDAGPPTRRSLEPMPIPTRNTPPTPVERFRKDYAPLAYLIDSVSLNIDIREEQTMVTSTLRVQPQGNSAGQSLDLDGVDLTLSASVSASITVLAATLQIIDKTAGPYTIHDIYDLDNLKPSALK